MVKRKSDVPILTAGDAQYINEDYDGASARRLELEAIADGSAVVIAATDLRKLKAKPRALKREQAETLNDLLSLERLRMDNAHQSGDQLGWAAYRDRIEGIRACIKALGFSEKGGVK